MEMNIKMRFKWTRTWTSQGLWKC